MPETTATEPGEPEDTEELTVRVHQTIYGNRREDPDAMMALNIREQFGDYEDGADAIGTEEFERAYEFAGEDQVPDLNALSKLWNVGPGPISETFVELNKNEQARSLSTGDLVAVNGTVEGDGDVYLVDRIGFTEIPALTGGN